MESNLYRCSPRRTKKFAMDCLYAGLVPYVQSSPGMGKSAIMRAIAKELNLFLIDHRLSTSPPEDLSGLPYFKDGKAYFAPFGELFPVKGTELPKKYDDAGNVIGQYDGWLVFLDEFPSAKKDTQAAAYKLILDKMVGQHDLHELVLLAAAGNLATDRAIVNPIGTAMQSRVIHIEMQISFDEWLYDVALKEGYDGRIVSFLSQHQSKLMDFRPDHNDRTFACPRTWEFMNKFLADKPVVVDDDTALFAGTIGSGIACEFVQFTKVFNSLVRFEDIVADPLNCTLPANKDIQWATISIMMDRVNDKNFDKVTQYVDRFSSDFRILFYRSILVRHPHLRESKAFQGAMSSLSQYLHG